MVLEVVAIVGAAILLMILVKGHIYLIKRVWKPVFEEEGEQLDEEEPPST